MANNKIVFRGKPFKSGGSICLILPPEIQEYLDMEYDEDKKPTTELSMIPDESRHGRFIGLWNPKQQEAKK